MLRFVIDETCWQFDGLCPEDCLEIVEGMLDEADRAFSFGHAVCYSDDLFQSAVLGEKKFYELYGNDSPLEIPYEVRERIAAAFGRMNAWEEFSQWPLSLDVAISDEPEQFAPSIAWAHAQGCNDESLSVACIVHPLRRQGGQVKVVINNRAAPLWFVSNVSEFQSFFRWLIDVSTKSPDGFCSFSASAFHNLDFVDRVWDGIKSMSKPYTNLKTPLIAHLSALSDQGGRIFSEAWAKAPHEFGSLKIDLSDENGNTKSNKVARRERTRTFEGESLIFWWHSKLEPHQDRIHFCPDRVPNGGKIIIGVFCKHLTC